MGSFSNSLEAQVINATLRGTTLTAPSVADLHLALFTADPTDANVTANEVSAGWYARQATGTWVSPAVGGDGKTATSNTTSITFPAVTDAQATITHVGIYDALVNGNLLYHQVLVAPKTLEIGDVISFAIGSLELKVD